MTTENNGGAEAAKDTIQWCLGVPMTGSRLLDDSESPVLKRLLDRLKRKMSLKTGVVPALALALAACVRLGWLGSSGEEWLVLWLAVIIVTALAWPFALFSAYEDFRLRRALAQDMASGKVLRFEGVIRRDEVPDDRVMETLREQSAILDSAVPQWFELLPRSGLLLRTHMGLMRKPVRLLHVELAVSGADGFAVHVADKFPGADPKLLCRHMTRAEAGEIVRRIPGLRREGLLSTALFVLLSVSLALSWFMEHKLFDNTHLLLLAVLLFGTGRLVAALIKRLRICSQFTKDVKEGFVFIDPDEQMEFLPCSTLVWATRRKPALWRLFS